MSSRQIDPNTNKPSKCKVKEATSSAKTILAASHPNLLTANPRPGGFVKVTPSQKLSYSSISHLKSQQSMRPTSSRDQRINTVLESRWDFSTSEPDLAEYGALVDHMLAVTISCVMLMAANAPDIRPEYLMCAQRYLSCIKNEEENHPPNIQGILNHIKYLQANLPKQQTSECCNCSDRTASEYDESEFPRGVKKRSSSRDRGKQFRSRICVFKRKPGTPNKKV